MVTCTVPGMKTEVTQDTLIGHYGELKQFHWFVLAHLERPDGSLVTGGADTEREAARRAGLR